MIHGTFALHIVKFMAMNATMMNFVVNIIPSSFCEADEEKRINKHGDGKMRN